MNLSELIVNDIATIVGYDKSKTKAHRKKLLAMGMTTGQVIQVTRYAPLGDPIEIKIRNFPLTLRKLEAEIVLVEKVSK